MVRTRQEELVEDPWQMLVVCQMLNQTSWRQVDQCTPTFFTKWPTAEKLVEASQSEIIEVIRPLGFYNRRSFTLLKFSLAWIDLCSQWPSPRLAPLDKIQSLPGIGKYALDSWRIFQLRDYTAQPTDKVLRAYLDEIQMIQ